MIDSFSGEYRFLSNFYREQDGSTIEHHFQAAKSLEPDVRRWVLAASTPTEAKKRGRHLQLRNGWEDDKLNVMLALLRMKFSDPELAQKLLATGDAELVEGNTWGDREWGVCNGVGKNLLGRSLMKIRDELKGSNG